MILPNTGTFSWKMSFCLTNVEVIYINNFITHMLHKHLEQAFSLGLMTTEAKCQVAFSVTLLEFTKQLTTVK